MNQKPSKRRNAKIGAFTVFGKIMKFIIIAFFIAFLIGGVYATKIILGIAQEAPEVNLKKFLALNKPSIMMDMDGVQMDIIHTDEVRFPVALSEMGQTIQDAFLSIEDERFYKHKGVDYRRTISVTAKDLIGRITGNRDLQGGSTLTQQISKNTFLT
jgi:penicillin-binding protein 1A